MVFIKSISLFKWILPIAVVLTSAGFAFDKLPAWHMKHFQQTLAWVSGDSTASISESAHGYKTQIFSRDPLVIYIHDFVSSQEIAHLIKLRYS